MSRYLSIPYNTSEIKEDDIFDMNNIIISDITHDISLQKYALLYIRNIGVKNDLSFEKCSFECKSEYLKLFLSTNINVDIPILASTWIEILSYACGISDRTLVQPSILTIDEIKLFIESNLEFVNKVRRLINSLTLYATYHHMIKNECECDMSSIEFSDDTEIKIMNFYQLSAFPVFPLLMEVMPPEERTPIYYKVTFDDSQNLYSMSRMMENLPLFQLLGMMFAPPEQQKSFVADIENSIAEMNAEMAKTRKEII